MGCGASQQAQSDHENLLKRKLAGEEDAMIFDDEIGKVVILFQISNSLLREAPIPSGSFKGPVSVCVCVCVCPYVRTRFW